MHIQPISALNFTSKTNTSNNNDSEKSTVATITGLATGLALSGLLYNGQMRSLKTISGKRNLILGYHEHNKTLNQVKKRIVNRDKSGKIIPPKDGITDRTKSIVKDFRNNLLLWGAGITAITTIAGRLIDSSLNDKRTVVSNNQT